MAEPRAERRSLSITIALAAATVGVIYGYDTGSSAGALPFIPDPSISPPARRSGSRPSPGSG